MSEENEKTVMYFEEAVDILGILRFAGEKSDKEVLRDFFGLCWFVCNAYGDMECVTGNPKAKVKVTIKKVEE